MKKIKQKIASLSCTDLQRQILGWSILQKSMDWFRPPPPFFRKNPKISREKICWLPLSRKPLIQIYYRVACVDLWNHGCSVTVQNVGVFVNIHCIVEMFFSAFTGNRIPVTGIKSNFMIYMDQIIQYTSCSPLGVYWKILPKGQYFLIHSLG